jgi:hypothetical protein
MNFTAFFRGFDNLKICSITFQNIKSLALLKVKEKFVNKLLKKISEIDELLRKVWLIIGFTTHIALVQK